MANAPSELRDIFCEAMDHKTAQERSQYLDRSCRGKPELRARVEALLRAHGEASRFLQETPGQSAADSDKRSREEPGTILGPYRLLEQIGEGGFGLVFLAEQQHPVRRQVAIKVLKPGMDSRQVIARFEAERQALALMDHPNIAKILDAGTTGDRRQEAGDRSKETGDRRQESGDRILAPDSCLLSPDFGRPYFVMELVRGVPITDYCDQGSLSTRQRLELFVTICDAVQHAHQKGIIHRDIKPSNVLVTQQDDKAVAKVIDFGIAKALGQRLTDKTLYTGALQMIGSPLYMSPEQAQLGGLDIDTRTDVYSLGVLLFELLTGTTPFDEERLHLAGYDEMRRIIRDEEPPRLSARLTTLGQAATTLATRRQSDPRRLSRLFQGDLDWIVMKALEKDRARRYESARGLADDVESYLHDEPVSACPPSAWYRFGKLARRNKWTLVTTVLVALALIAGTVVSAWQAVRATLAADSERQALVNLAGEQKATQRELFDSLVAQARANRLSRRSGQRFRTLEIVRQATGMARRLGLPAPRFLELRNEAIAAMALPDMRVAWELMVVPGATLNKEALAPSALPDKRAVPEPTVIPGAAVDFDPTLQRFAYTDVDGNLHVRKTEEGAEILLLPGLGPGEVHVCFSPDGRFLALNHNRGQCAIWKLDGPEPDRFFARTVRPGSGMGFSPDSRHAAIQHADGSIGVFALADKREINHLPPFATTYHLAIDPTGRQLALAYASGVQVRDLQTGKLVWQQKDTRAGWPYITWHPDEQVLAVADDEAIYLWDVPNGKQIGKLGSWPGTACVFNRAGTLLASCGWDGICRLWDPRASRQLFSTPAYLCAHRFSSDGRFYAADVHYDKLRIWEIASGSEHRILTEVATRGKSAYFGTSVNSDGSMVAAGRGGGGVVLWDLRSGKELAFLGAAPGMTLVTLGPSAGRTWAGSADADILAGKKADQALFTMGIGGMFRWPLLRDSKAGSLHVGSPEKLPFPGIAGSIAQSSDGTVLASAQSWGALVARGEQPDHLIRLPHRDTRHVAVSPNGQWVVTGAFSAPGGAVIWDARTGKQARELPVGRFCYSAFSPDGTRFVTCGGGSSVHVGVVKLWEVGTWAELPFSEPVMGTSPAFSPDGKILVVESGVGAARLLDAVTGSEYARLEDPDQDRASYFAFTPDGTKLVSSTNDSLCIRIWDLKAIRGQLAEMDLDWISSP